MASEQELKRLAPVASAASNAVQLASKLHARALSAVPEKYMGSVQGTEEQLMALASPYVALLSDKAPVLLHAVDSKVDSAILSAWTSFTANRAAVGAAVGQKKAAVEQTCAAGLEQLAAARQAYLKRLEESVAYVREQGVQGAAKAAAESLLSKVEEAKGVPTIVLTEISEAWTKLAGMPAVERVLAASKGQVESAYSSYMAAHGALVGDPRYAAAVAKGTELLASVQATNAYKAAACRLTPLLAPYAETAARMAGPYVAMAAAHLTPAAA